MVSIDSPWMCDDGLTCSDHSGPQVPCQIRRDCDSGKGDDHSSVGQTDREGGTGGGDKGIGRVQDRPDDQSNEAVHEELDEEEIAQALVLERECTKDTDQAFRWNSRGQKSLKLLTVHAPDEKTGEECAQDLCKDVTNGFSDWETLEDDK